MRHPRVHLVPHTHWDREWYKSAEQFRVGLVDLVAEVVGSGHPFLLDGQGVILEDLLSWASGQQSSLAAALQSGVIEAGPWYVLADNQIPSGEALVRNLLAGRKAVGVFGATPPAVLYCPDTFGHPAVAPILAAGFGFPLAVVWRGYGGRGWPAGDMARWRAADGTEVLLYHLPPSGYEFGSNLPTDAAAARLRWDELQRVLGERSTSGELLVLNGADHHALQEQATTAWTALSEVVAPARAVMQGLQGFARAFTEFASSHRAPVVSGELRASPGYVWALPGTLATRAAQKRANAGVERLLVGEVEPWAALATWRGVNTPEAGLSAAWRLVLQSHPHDTLCGCSVDSVALAMDDRMRRAQELATELRHRTLGALVSPKRLTADATHPVVVLTNPAARSRNGVAEVEIDYALGRVAVGPGSGSDLPALEPVAVSVGEQALPMQVLSSEQVFVRDEHTRRYPRNFLVQRVRALVYTESLPPLGVCTLPIVPRASRRRPPHRVKVVGGVLDNGRLQVWCSETDGLCISRDGRTLTDVLGFESQGERGDLYTHSAVPGTTQMGRIVRVRVAERGPLRASLELLFRVPVAEREIGQATGALTTHAAATIDVKVIVSLDADAPWIRLSLRGDNRLTDYRLRAVIRTRHASSTHLADAAFGPVTRLSGVAAPEAGDVEIIPPTAPLHRYVSLFSASSGVSVFSDGLAEYEATPDGDVAVTLLRAVGELSRSSLPERAGHAGWPVATPLAQCQGPFQATLAVLLHGPDIPATRDAIERTAEDVLLPVRGITLQDGSIGEMEGVTLMGRGLRLLACKPAEDGRGIIVRFANVTGSHVVAQCALPGLARAWLARLDETVSGALATNENRVQLHVGPHAVVTLRLDATS